MSSQQNHEVSHLIRRFQRLFAEVGPGQIVERLLRLAMARPMMENCTLITPSDDGLRVEASISRSGFEQVSELLVKRPELPQDFINSAFEQARPMQVDLGRDTGLQTVVSRDSRSVILQPIGEPLIALLYCEASCPLSQLQAQSDWLASIWRFTELVLLQLQQQRQPEPIDHKFDQLLESLWTSRSYLNAILRNSPALIGVIDLCGRVVLLSDRCDVLLGVEQHAVIGKTLNETLGEELATEIGRDDRRVIETQEPLETRRQLTHKDGSLHTYMVVKFPLKNRRDELIGVCTIANDISLQLQAESTLREQQSRLSFVAFHDELTGLPNRSLFYDRIQHSLARCRRSGNQVVLMVLDIDRFKLINDSLSHDAGDLLLQVVAKRLLSNVRDMDTVARLGGDEFVVVLEGIQENDDVSHLANKMLTDIARPTHILGHDIASSVSMGIGLYPHDGENAETLLKNAEAAMYKAKDAGKNNFKFFTEDMNASAVKSLLMENELRRAIESDQLSLHYQPQFDLSSNEISGMEVLVRWKHPQRGLVSPVHFIPLAEETGLIVALGDWVLRHACMQAKTWLEQGKYDKKIAINLSPRQFRQHDFIKRLAEILAMTGLPAEHLELEITETCAMEQAGEIINMMEEINAMGVSLAIDDFGTGYSSLAYLKKFPIQKLKIDRSFVKDITTDVNDAAIAQSIVSLAHNMSLKVIAEGVEFGEQATWLQQRGCDMAQGFHYCKPVSGPRLSTLLVAGKYVEHANVVHFSQGSGLLGRTGSGSLD